MDNAEGKFISPEVFIPLAEKVNSCLPFRRVAYQ